MSDNNQSEKELSIETSNRSVPGRSPSKSRRVSLGRHAAQSDSLVGSRLFPKSRNRFAAQEAQAAAVRDIVAKSARSMTYPPSQTP